MKRLLISLVVLGLLVSLATMTKVTAENTRDMPHKFRAFTANTEGLPGCNIFRITGVATASNGVFGLYNSATLAAAAATNVAVEGGEATSGDPLPLYEFSGEGLALNTGLTVVRDGCTVVIEYL